MRFDGQTYNPTYDLKRLSSQLLRVAARMSDNEWHTLNELVDVAGGTTASISARVRDLRKPRFGGHTVEAKRVAGGTWAYRVVQ